MVRKTEVQFLVESYQILKKCYFMPLCNQSYKVWIREKWSNPRKGVAPFIIVAIEKGTFRSPSTTIANFTYIYIYIYIWYVRAEKIIVIEDGIGKLFSLHQCRWEWYESISSTSCNGKIVGRTVDSSTSKFKANSSWGRLTG